MEWNKVKGWHCPTWLLTAALLQTFSRTGTVLVLAGLQAGFCEQSAEEVRAVRTGSKTSCSQSRSCEIRLRHTSAPQTCTAFKGQAEKHAQSQICCRKEAKGRAEQSSAQTAGEMLSALSLSEGCWQCSAWKQLLQMWTQV